VSPPRGWHKNRQTGIRDAAPAVSVLAIMVWNKGKMSATDSMIHGIDETQDMDSEVYSIADKS
jgi:hypothetical protein